MASDVSGDRHFQILLDRPEMREAADLLLRKAQREEEEARGEELAEHCKPYGERSSR